MFVVHTSSVSRTYVVCLSYIRRLLVVHTACVCLIDLVIAPLTEDHYFMGGPRAGRSPALNWYFRRSGAISDTRVKISEASCF